MVTLDPTWADSWNDVAGDDVGYITTTDIDNSSFTLSTDLAYGEQVQAYYYKPPKEFKCYHINEPVYAPEGCKYSEIKDYEPIDQLRMKVARWLKNPPKTH